jgi:effector-binding domain-containing protein
MPYFLLFSYFILLEKVGGKIMSDYKIIIEGILETEETHVMGFERFMKFEDIKKNITEDSKKLDVLLTKDKHVKIEGSRMNIVKGISPDLKYLFSIYGIAVELSDGANNILNEKHGVWAILPPHPSVLKVSLHGSYENLAETWKKTMEFICKNKLAIDTYSSPWEVYVSDDKNNLITEIYVPLILTIDNDLDKIEM